MKRFIIFFLVCLALMRVPFITGCANIVPPSGGPKDTLPPVLIEADPEMRALNVPVNTNKIVLNFDEYVDLKDISKNLIVSPVPKQMPIVHSHLKIITITIKDTLQPNTTYALNFGKAVVDVNEGNILKNFTYVFSTGSYIDSLQYSGRVIMANTGKPDSTLIVMLHSQLADTAVAKFRPRYITRLDSGGNFTFKNIRPDIYALYALEDQSGMHLYTSKSQVFAFADSPVDLRVSTKPLLLYAFADTSDLKHPKKPVAPAPAKKEKEDKEKVKRLIVTGNIPNGLLDLHNQLELTFALPIRDFDSTMVRLTNDSFQDFKDIHFEFDSTSKKLTIYHAWKEDTRYHLVLQKNFADDTLGEKLLKIDTIRFKTKAESDYGNLRLRFKNLDLSRHPVLLFIQGEKIILSSVIGRSYRYNNKLFEPGDYELRILYDTNQNGVWDPGDFYKHLQPEIVVPIRKKLSVRANWDNEVDISL
ncbi:MAG TPA: Ig-like domain-containing domain [Puia sp.]|nr:Ig-like domain-containing domain [Puia sp.]